MAIKSNHLRSGLLRQYGAGWSKLSDQCEVFVRVSVVTACYNSAETIGDALQSLRTQRDVSLESIVKDGGSKDSTAAVVGGFEDIVNTFVSEPDGGVYDALNKGIELATGDVVGILHSDDLYADEYVLRDVCDLFRRSDADCVYGDLVYVDRDDPSQVRRYWKAGAYRPGAFRRGWMPPHPTVFVRREVYERYGLFRDDMRTAADYELMLRLFHRHGLRCAYLPRILVRMRVGGVSNISLANRLNANREDNRAWEVNGLSPLPWTRLLKPLRKLPQYVLRPPKESS